MSESPLPPGSLPDDRARRAPLTRRRVLGAGTALAAGVIAPAMFGSARGSAAAATSTARTGSSHSEALRALGRTTLRKPGSRPFPQLPAGADTLSGIKHIVVLMMENHSFDNMFGMLGRGDGFTLGANGWFSSVMAQTFPNRRYLIAGTSAGMTDDGGTSALTLVVPADGTIFNRLDHYGISWENYVATYPSGATPELFPLNDGVPEQLHHKALADFFTDAAAGQLPAFSFLDPNFGSQSQENPQNIIVGEALIAKVVRAIGASPQWLSTLFVLMYDEHGGYYDHVPPPKAIPPDDIDPIVQPGESTYDGFARYGFRVPAVVVSPYAKPGYVSHVLYDHTSVLAMVERKWNLPALTYRDANANDLTDFLDLKALAAKQPTFPALPPLTKPGNTKARLACTTTGAGTIPPPGSISG